MLPSPIYQSYLLRLWRDNPTAPWRALLQSTADGETYHFGEVAALFEFLAACLTVEGAVAGQEQPDSQETQSKNTHPSLRK